MSRQRPGAAGRLRIVGGSHRGRKLAVPSQAGLRPTSDRVRETLFNWLSPVIEGARCLDLFAGSGALGLESASRGATRVVLVERSESVARALRESVRTLRAAQVSVVRADARRWLDGHGEPFDLVFLDPPFDADLLARCCELLAANGWLAPGALIYLEADASKGFPDLPDRWRLVREKRAGRVCFGLAAAGDGYRIVD